MRLTQGAPQIKHVVAWVLLMCELAAVGGRTQPARKDVPCKKPARVLKARTRGYQCASCGVRCGPVRAAGISASHVQTLAIGAKRETAAPLKGNILTATATHPTAADTLYMSHQMITLLHLLRQRRHRTAPPVYVT